jgi:hypothetical protein
MIVARKLIALQNSDREKVTSQTDAGNGSIMQEL